MKTLEEFIFLLDKNKHKELSWEYGLGKEIPNTYQITELKEQSIKGVDCENNLFTEKQSIIQLYARNTVQNYVYCCTETFLDNLIRLQKVLKPDVHLPLYFEFGGRNIATSLYQIYDTDNTSHQLKIYLKLQQASCKPQNHVGI